MKDFNLFFQKLVDIKESWEIFKIFENEREKFSQEKEEYQIEIQKDQEKLRQCRNEILELRAEVLELKKQKEAYEESLVGLKEKRVRQNVQKNVEKLMKEKDALKNKKQEVLPEELKEVEVFLENGEIKKLRAARKVYDESLFSKYRIALKEGREFRNKIAELELENSQLKIELRDAYTEMILKERMGKNEDIS
ncbi:MULTISPECIES: nickel-binding protein Mua [unclassified Helicobacter]|uniref:nickel-binding protein Mua n=1 Tax=unclassified Helicobacter TaxID=2593540 RepID=UPI000CF1B82E|nr:MULTISPECIES: nickel-binding protein Mua [unclassified Helicobacter]